MGLWAAATTEPNDDDWQGVTRKSDQAGPELQGGHQGCRGTARRSPGVTTGAPQIA